MRPLHVYEVTNERDLRSDYTLHAAIQAGTAHDERRALWRRDDNTITIDTPMQPLPLGWRLVEVKVPPEPEEGRVLLVDAWLNPCVTRDRKRHALPASDQPAWAARQFERIGLRPLMRVQLAESRAVTGHKVATGRITLVATRFVTLASVLDPEPLVAAVESGVGHGKALGLGLVTLNANRRGDT